MIKLHDMSTILLLEQDSKLMTLRKAITERLPITINYAGPSPEVLSGVRYDIEPVVLGKNAKSGNLVIWAYVFKGTSKKGIPNWKMFRVDRIVSAEISDLNVKSFKLSDLPGYEKGKAPNAMRSLSSVEVYSPYWFEDYKRNKNKPVQPAPPQPLKRVQVPVQPPQEIPTAPEGQPQGEIPIQPDNGPIESPNLNQHKLDVIVYNSLKPKIIDRNGIKTITTMDYQNALKDLHDRKEGEWKNYQRMISGNARPGEGTRQRFNTSSKNELDALLSNDNVQISDEGIENLTEILKRFSVLIYS